MEDPRTRLIHYGCLLKCDGLYHALVTDFDGLKLRPSKKHKFHSEKEAIENGRCIYDASIKGMCDEYVSTSLTPIQHEGFCYC